MHLRRPRASRASLFVLTLSAALADSARAAPDKHVGADALRCTLLVSAAGAQRSLSLALRNEGRAPVVLEYFSPVILRQFTASIGGARVAVTEPAIDLPVRAERQTLAPGATRTIASVIRLRFAPPAGAPREPDDRFVWTLEHAPALVSLEGYFGDARSSVACRGVLAP